VFGLSTNTTKDRLEEIFSKHGQVESVTLVFDRQTGKSKGYGFVYFDTIETAAKAKEALGGQEIDGRRVRIDFSMTQRAHEPTPGRYMGSNADRDRFRSGGRDRDRSRSRDRDRGGSRGRSRSRDRDRGRRSSRGRDDY